MDLAKFGRTALGLDEGKALTAADYRRPGPQLHAPGTSGRRISSRTAHQHLQAYGGSEPVDWLMDCIALRAETASSAGYQFCRDGKTYLPEKQEDSTDSVLPPRNALLGELFKAPNPWITWTDLIQLTIIDYLLAGNSFWLKYKPYANGKALALYRLAPPLINIIPGERKLVDRYEYRVPGANPVTYAPENIVHFKRPNPHDPWLGLGLVAGGPRVLDMELALVESQASYYARGTKLSGVLQTDRSVPDPIMRAIRRAWAGLYGGPPNSGSVAVLQRGMKFQAIQSNATQAAFEPITKMSRDRICAMTRTPVPLVSMETGLDPKAVREAQRLYDTKTMRPMLDALQEQISRDVTQAWSYDFEIPYEYVMPPEDALDLATGMSSLPGVRIKEIRAQAGLPPLGDDRDDIVLNLPGDNTNASTVKDRNLPGEAGRPPNPENTRAIPPGPLPRDAQASTAPSNPAARASQRG